jgi:LAS superfamily LD-carboxypeptidase LdcB
MLSETRAFFHRIGNTTFLFIFLGIFIFFLFVSHTQKIFFEEKIYSLENSLASTTEKLLLLEEENEKDLEEIRISYSTLTTILEENISELSTLSRDISEVSSNARNLKRSVETLEKIATTDKQLLQKYSKVYFLNEHYMPEGLTIIDKRYDFENGKEVSVHSKMWPFLKDLLRDAERDDIDLMVLSGYRSYKEQATLKGNYLATYGTGANTFSADQGYSEHQLGTAVDFTTKGTEGNLSLFEKTEAFVWLEKNAHRYGFTLSYPKENEYYEYEPWHWRFVGSTLAQNLYRKGKHFYDLDQREINEYLAEMFD